MKTSETDNWELSTVEPKDARRPPFLGSWLRIYGFVFSFLALLIVLMYIFMRVFS